MNNEQLLAALKKAHEFDVADRQQGEQRLADLIAGFERRITSLETFRTQCKTVFTGLGVVSTALGTWWTGRK